jgi:hypothetical protein
MANPNLQLLTDAARLLEPILGEWVFETFRALPASGRKSQLKPESSK